MSRDDMMDIEEFVEQRIAIHERDRHHPSIQDMFPNKTPEQVVREYVMMAETIEKMVENQEILKHNQDHILDVVVGPYKKDWKDEITDERDEQLGLKHMLANGGIKLNVPWVKILLALISSGTVTAVVVQLLSGSPA